jgi:hypothetical protein
MLKEALGGNSRTTMIVCCSEAEDNEVETISTLRFGTVTITLFQISHRYIYLTYILLYREQNRLKTKLM